MEQVVREHGLEDQVRLLGGQGRDAILELYRLADIILVPSVRSENVEEATSLSALEAMACGRPLIAGAVGGLAEMVDDGENGLLVPDADAEALAAAILRLAADPELGARLAADARDYVVRAPLAPAGGGIVRRDLRAGRGRDGSLRRRARGPSRPGGRRAGLPRARALSPPGRRCRCWAFRCIALDVEDASAWLLAEARQTPPTFAGEGVGPPIAGAASVPCRIAVSFNPELVMRAIDDPVAAEAVLDADLRFPDGVGAVWAAGRQGVAGLTRVPGIELAERLLAGAARESAAGLPTGGCEGRGRGGRATADGAPAGTAGRRHRPRVLRPGRRRRGGRRSARVGRPRAPCSPGRAAARGVPAPPPP